LTITYTSLEQLDGLIQRLSRETGVYTSNDGDDAFDDEDVLELDAADALETFPHAGDVDPVASWEAESGSGEFTPFDGDDDGLGDTSDLDSALDAPLDLDGDDEVEDVVFEAAPADAADLDSVLLAADPVDEDDSVRIDTADLDAVLVSAEEREEDTEPVADLDALSVKSAPKTAPAPKAHPAVATINALDDEEDLDDSFDLDDEILEVGIPAALNAEPVASWEAELGDSAIDLDALDGDLMAKTPAKTKRAPVPGKPTASGGIELED
jgi:hypothetical protein